MGICYDKLEIFPLIWYNYSRGERNANNFSVNQEGLGMSDR